MTYVESKRLEQATIFAVTENRNRSKKFATFAKNTVTTFITIALIAMVGYHWIVVDVHHDEIAAREALISHHNTRANASTHTLTLVGDPQTIARAAHAAGKAIEGKK